jgi:hypothetical protein
MPIRSGREVVRMQRYRRPSGPIDQYFLWQGHSWLPRVLCHLDKGLRILKNSCHEPLEKSSSRHGRRHEDNPTAPPQESCRMSSRRRNCCNNVSKFRHWGVVFLNKASGSRNYLGLVCFLVLLGGERLSFTSRCPYFPSLLRDTFLAQVHWWRSNKEAGARQVSRALPPDEPT